MRKTNLGSIRRIHFNKNIAMLRSKLEKGSGSQDDKRTCGTYGKKLYGKCPAGRGNCFGRGNKGHKVINFPSIASKGKSGKQVPLSFLSGNVQRKNHFYEHQAKVS